MYKYVHKLDVPDLESFPVLPGKELCWLSVVLSSQWNEIDCAAVIDLLHKSQNSSWNDLRVWASKAIICSDVEVYVVRVLVIITQPSKNVSFGTEDAVHDWFNRASTPVPVTRVTVAGMRTSAVKVTFVSDVESVARSACRLTPPVYTLITCATVPVPPDRVVMTSTNVFIGAHSVAMDTVDAAASLPTDIVDDAFLTL